MQSIIRRGSNCWKVARANRFGVIVDAGDYFPAVKDAILQARESVCLIGWDFDTRIKLEVPEPHQEGPNKLGRFLRWIAKRRPELQIYVLRWDLSAFNGLFRGTMPFRLLDLMTASNIRFKLDGAHPTGSAHHQKIVVIDDVLAFCGGIDMTADRWDTPQHLDRDVRRRRPSGKLYGPWHDATSVLDGPVARLLGDLARDRWHAATGEHLPIPSGARPIWPAAIEPLMTDVDVAIARTLPAHADQPEVREIEQLYLDGIAGARHTIYFESQYFASRRIAEAIAARLREPDGPEVVVVNPRSADGLIEAKTMDTARARLLGLVREADRWGRFHIYTPVTANGVAIYVHAKVMIVDDRFLRIGSSNLNNRSLGFDSECDVAIDAAGQADPGAVSEAITRVRNGLVAEHLGTTAASLQAALDASGGLLADAIERTRGQGKTLVPYVPDEIGPIEELLAENELLDPERHKRWQDLLLGR
ncbi:phospholipase D-like domain-containing protein [Chthonobacter albigriseus]|uniref:phospholipase D-like domain-containing protein n=1 Tax=Chthonobacter albigriseus TaxID=1683161 RepID=UPI0015EF22DE|nr:phospholipase D-like domain-containing protein [Chthonobacter albigriseus]